MAEYRNLTPGEISSLQLNFCTADSWDNIKVSEGFTPDNVRYVSFSGNVKLGKFENSFTFGGGMVKHSGLFNVSLHNVEIGNDCYIANIGNYISNYVIGEGCYISNVDIITTDGLSTFGNGIEVSVLNETGGREVMIYDKLSAHQAYLMAFFTHSPELVSKLKQMIRAYADSIASSKGFIGNNVTIVDTGMVKNVRIGDCAKIEAASTLRNGTINSNQAAPVSIGVGVLAQDFIISSGARLSVNVTLERCFVGQASILADTYFASDSLFFANCYGGNGEACSIFAGPFTVSHHKSTLLIAGMFSFMNAGSGSNQSNHMYKLGPVHYGILGRGSKTSSDSYILWPTKTGAFSLIMGRHTSHLDTTIFPFSYLIENHSSTFIFPGANLKSVGTIRDVKKWPTRDRREADKIDCINFNLLSPYTMQHAFEGLNLLKEMSRTEPEGGLYKFGTGFIKHSSLVKGINLYSLMADKFLGNSLVSRIMKSSFNDIESLRQALKPDTNIGKGKWCDISGLIAPSSEVEKLSGKILDGSISDIDEVNTCFCDIHSNYYSYEWTWTYDAINNYYGVDLSSAESSDIISIIKSWKDSVISLDHMLIQDAQKEFRLASFMDNEGQNEKNRMENDPFVQTVREHIESKSTLFAEVLDRLSFK